MANNSIGKIFRVTTWGEAHGPAIGAIIDGCPAGIEIHEDEINVELSKRFPSKNHFVTHKDLDAASIYSGVFEGKTTGAPILLLINNKDCDIEKYESIKNLLRPGHANYTYLEKYGVFDYRGGGRSSNRETVCRIAAGAIAKKLLRKYGITPLAYIKEIAGVQADISWDKIKNDPHSIYDSPIYCPDPIAAEKMMDKINDAHQNQDSVGGVVELYVQGMPVGLGDPVYSRLDAELAFAMMSIPSTKGFEVGSGFMAARMRGSEHNDGYIFEDQHVRTTTNYAGGVLGGISNGMPVIARIAFKPPSSILQPQQTIDIDGRPALLQLPPESRYDPCTAIRGVSVVEAMASIVITDAILANWCARID